jgi:hypothetical protein
MELRAKRTHPGVASGVKFANPFARAVINPYRWRHQMSDQFNLEIQVSANPAGDSGPQSISVVTRLVCTRVTCRTCTSVSCISQCPISCW